VLSIALPHFLAAQPQRYSLGIGRWARPPTDFQPWVDRALVVVCHLDEDVGVAWRGQPTGARQVFASKLGQVDRFLAKVIPIEDEGAGFPTACLHGSRDV